MLTIKNMAIIALIVFTTGINSLFGTENSKDDDVVVELSKVISLFKSEENQARIERIISVPLPRTSRKKAMSYVIEHRTSESINRDTFHSFLGFDSGNIKIGIGVLYGLTDWIDISAYRSNGTVERFDTYQFTARTQLLKEKDKVFDVAIIFGGSLFTIRGENDVWANLVYGLIGKSMFNKFYLSSGILYHEDSTAKAKTSLDRNESTAILGGVLLKASDLMYFATEASIPINGYKASSMAWTSAIKWATHRHTFAVLVGNTQYISLDGLAAGTSSKSDDFLIGFSITREFNL